VVELKKGIEISAVVIEIIKKMQQDNTVVIVEGQHDISALREVVEYLSSKGKIEKKEVYAVTFDRLLHNNLEINGQRIIIAMDGDRRGEEKKEQAIALIRERYPQSTIDESTGRRLLKILGTNCIEGIVGPIKEFEKTKR
jgi:5S rRNA maturation endonuclease (ribonuclease M5)